VHWHYFLEVDPPLKVARDIEFLVQRLSAHLVAIEVSAGQEGEFGIKDSQSFQESVHSVDGISNRDTSIYLFLSDPSELGAERCQLMVYRRFHIGLELRNYFLLLHIDNHDGELNDFLQELNIRSLTLKVRSLVLSSH